MPLKHEALHIAGGVGKRMPPLCGLLARAVTIKVARRSKLNFDQKFTRLIPFFVLTALSLSDFQALP